MSKVLVIGCGGVAGVAISKCCQVSEVFTELCIASRTKSKCDALAAKLAPITKTKITTAQVDADDVQQLCDLIQSYKPDLVMNIALPYQDLTIMDACLACGVNYMDTANYEPENTDDPEWRAIYEKRCKEAGFSAYFDYSWQWAYKKKFEEAGLTALLGCGFDPGVTQAYCAYAKKHEFDTIDTIDILDCNGGDHGYAFATNFNPEINLREVSAPGSYWENGHWVEIPAMSIIMSKVLVIGCGGVAGVAISKCCQVSEVFTELCIASRTKSKCDALAAKLAPITKTKITTAQVDADDVQQLCDLIQSYKPDLVMNIALPYQDLTIMDACLACGVNYMDTANYEPENTDDPEWRAIYEKRCKEAGFSAYFDYSWQWAYKKKFEEAGLTALLGCGFDPGVTQAYCAYAKKHEFDTIDTIDILDCNGGDHGYAFATNFNPEINLREVSAPGSYWENGHWVEIPAMSIKRAYTFDQVGQKDMYLLHHEEIESLGKNLPEVKRIRFFMTFGQSYLDHMRCLEDVGMLSTTPIHYNGQEIVPIQFLKALLPDPASLGPRTKGKTNIGCIFTGKKDGKEKTYYIYNVCDHQECYREVGSQAISYTTGVPAMCGALMMLTGKWTKPGVYTVEEFDPDPFLDALDKYGLPRSENHDPALVD